ncbi:Uncharacterized membrane protein [Mycolicibacterium neoaurum]|uniref:17 kDa surface antigen n=1 Tax=Mycolicibacterium neoaurum TaxID=1795 RepID=A0AAV2WJB5_MYCNE|nr:DUF4126 family protein [Mycolicibacterium neoaurum]TLH61361.1 DUF4126 domain-containing protein [Mycolicibacterium neoaurum]CDQ44310.1 17 kDa surface antigen [Mycolicibacterium neoaurum]SDD91774.1 Uncharacterized membrane protein [Mycolicibacterium neoaurum]
MTVVLVLLLALLIGVVAGLRALTPPAVVAWGGLLGWIELDGTWAQWLTHPITVTVLTILLVVELVTDQLPATPPRTVTMQFAARLFTGAFAGAVLVSGVIGDASAGNVISGIGAGVIGAVLGTMGGYRARKVLVERNGGRDLPVALVEDVIAVAGGFAVVYLASLI